MASETMADPVRTAPDPDTLNAFMGKMVGDMGACISGALVILGDRLGLYRALDELGPADPFELAGKTNLNARLVREWLCAQAAAEYISYDPLTGKFWLSPEQRMVFADEESPVFLAGGFELMAAVYKDEPKVAKAFQSGLGLGWHEHDVCLFRGTERFFRPGYNTNLTTN